MDIELARTFLEIVSTGSFIKAADRLHVAQTTVSARVRLLEQQLGRPLFVRNKAGASLTPAGEQFLRYAPTFVQLWQRAKQQVAVPEGHRAVLTVGSEVSLWQPLLVEWVRSMRRLHPDIALRVHVEWGPDFSLHHAVSFPDITPSLVANLGPLALSYVLLEGGSGYFRMHSVQPYLESGKLHLVPGAPHFSFPVYAVHSANVDAATLGAALTVLRAVAKRRSRSR